MLEMKRFLSLILTVILFCQMLIPASAAQTVSSVNLFEKYTARQIVAMYPDFAEYLAKELRALNEDISVERFCVSDDVINSVYLSVLCENPDIFYVNPKNFESTARYSDNILISIRPYYLFDVDKIPAEIERFDKNASSALSGVDESWSDFHKCRYLHDKLAVSCEYDLDENNESLNVYTSYGALVDNVAVCEGYTLAYNYLLSKVGIDSQYIQSLKAKHSWALVKLDGQYYHTDVTLDDPSYDNLGKVNHTFFLMSDALLRKNDKLENYSNMHTSWICPEKAPSEKYDNEWWRSVNTCIFRVGNLDYYVNQAYSSSIYGALIKRADSGSEKVVQKITTRWTVYKNKDGAFWEKAFCFLAFDGTYFYYNSSDEVFRAKPGSSYFEVVYTKPSSVEYNIYGLSFNLSGEFYVSIKESPNDRDTVYHLDSIIPANYNAGDPEELKATYYTPVADGVILNKFDVYSPNVILPQHIDNYTITELGNGVFMNNKTLSSVILPDGLRAIGDAAFYGCESLERVVIPESVTSIGKNAFAGAPLLTLVGKEGSEAERYAQEYGIHFLTYEEAQLEPSTQPQTEPVTQETQPTTAPETTAPTQPSTTATTTPSKTTSTRIKYKVSVTLYEDQSLYLVKQVRKSGTTFKVKNKKIVSVNSAGKIMGKKKGKTTITAKHKSYTASIKVTVKRAKLNKTKMTLKKGKTFTLKITGTSKLVTFKSSNKSVASVNYMGKITAKKSGSTVITVKYGKRRLSCKINVK